MPIINVTSSASSKKEMEQLVQTIGNASDSATSSSVFGKLNDIKNQFTQVWTPDKASKIDAAMTTRAPATTALSNTVWTNTRAAKVDNLDDKMTSRAPASTALTKTVWTDARAKYLDKINTNLDAAVSSRASANTALSNTVWTNARAAKVDNLDGKITSRAPANTALSNAIWTNARAAKVDNLDGKITSRAPASTALSNTIWTNARASYLDKVNTNLDAKISTVNTAINQIKENVIQEEMEKYYYYPLDTPNLTLLSAEKSSRRPGILIATFNPTYNGVVRVFFSLKHRAGYSTAFFGYNTIFNPVITTLRNTAQSSYQDYQADISVFKRQTVYFWLGSKQGSSQGDGRDSIMFCNRLQIGYVKQSNLTEQDCVATVGKFSLDIE